MREPDLSATPAAMETATVETATVETAVEGLMDIAAVKAAIMIVVKEAKPEADPHG